MERVPTKNNPKLMEAVIQEMQVQLANGLPWLNHIFGKAEKTVCDHDVLRQYYQKNERREVFYTPSVYVGKGKYESIVPDKKDWGNYAFFYTEESQKLSGGRRVQPYFDIKGTVNLVIWCDTRDIEAEDDRNLESIKSQVLQVLNGMRLTTGHVEWERIYEQNKNVFGEYSMFEEFGQYMIAPYCAFRFEGTVVYNSGCEG